MDYSATFYDEQGIKRTMSVSREDTFEAVRNDYSELMKKYNPDVVSINRCQTKEGEALRLEITVNAPSHYLTNDDYKTPKSCDSMTATVIVKMGYPLVSLEAFYDPKHFLASPNVFTSGKACIDAWVPFKSSLITVVDKLVHDMIHDPEVTRYDSMANSAMETWHKTAVGNGQFPTIDPSNLYMKERKAMPPRASGRSAAGATRSAPTLPPRKR